MGGYYFFILSMTTDTNDQILDITSGIKDFENEEKQYGELDYLASEKTLTYPKPKYNFYTPHKAEYNQNENGRNTCVITASMSSFGDLIGYEWNTDDMKILVALAEKEYGYDPAVGMHFIEGVRMIRNYFNKHGIPGWEKYEAFFYRIDLNSPLFWALLDRGYTFV